MATFSKYHYKLHHTTIDQLMTLKGSTVKVFLAIAKHANFTTGRCFPGYRTLTKMTGITSCGRLKAHIDILIDAGLVESREKVNGHYVYYIKTCST